MTARRSGVVNSLFVRGRSRMATDAQKRAEQKYKREKTKTVNLRFAPPEMHIYEYLSAMDNKSGYIKDLILADMEKQQ